MHVHLILPLPNCFHNPHAHLPVKQSELNHCSYPRSHMLWSWFLVHSCIQFSCHLGLSTCLQWTLTIYLLYHILQNDLLFEIVLLSLVLNNSFWLQCFRCEDIRDSFLILHWRWSSCWWHQCNPASSSYTLPATFLRRDAYQLQMQMEHRIIKFLPIIASCYCFLLSVLLLD